MFLGQTRLLKGIFGSKSCFLGHFRLNNLLFQNHSVYVAASPPPRVSSLSAELNYLRPRPALSAPADCRHYSEHWVRNSLNSRRASYSQWNAAKLKDRSKSSQLLFHRGCSLFVGGCCYYSDRLAMFARNCCGWWMCCVCGWCWALFGSRFGVRFGVRYGSTFDVCFDQVRFDNWWTVAWFCVVILWYFWIECTNILGCFHEFPILCYFKGGSWYFLDLIWLWVKVECESRM